MAKIIGSSTRIKDAMNMITDGLPPLVKYHGSLYVLETSGRQTGNLYYTKFSNIDKAEHSVNIPYSFEMTVGQLLDRGETASPKQPPRITQIPAASYAAFYQA